MFSVIFDMDGTLFDTQRIFIPAWDFAGEKQGFRNIGEHIPNVCGKSDEDWKQYLKDNIPGLDIPQFSDDAKEYVVNNLVLRYMPGAEELMKFLYEKGIRLAIASGSPHEYIDHHLGEVEATSYFEVTVSGSDVKRSKPAPDIFLLTAQKLGVDPKDCYVLEDSENGIRAAHAAGMKAIGVPDIVKFSDEVKAMETAEFPSMFEALEFFKGFFKE